MENTPVERKSKTTAKSQSHSSLRVRKATRKRVLEILTKANNKDFGRHIRSEDLILLAISRISSDDIAALQESSMSNSDRLDRDYKNYVAEHGQISKDEYLGKHLNGEIPSAVSSISKGEVTHVSN